jgi:hypothetical protein
MAMLPQVRSEPPIEPFDGIEEKMLGQGMFGVPLAQASLNRDGLLFIPL